MDYDHFEIFQNIKSLKTKQTAHLIFKFKYINIKFCLKFYEITFDVRNRWYIG